MSYTNTTHANLYHGSAGSYGRSLEECAFFWCEALATQRAWEVVKAWFRAMQAGEAALRYPDPLWQPKPGRKAITQELADIMVQEMDEDFLLQQNRFPKESGLGPEFSRLPPHARLAFMQEIMDASRTTREITQEASALIATGWLPPGWNPPQAAPPSVTVSEDQGQWYP